MKNLELINLLSLGNVVVAQPYENPEVKLKNFISKVESNILDKIQDEETKNLLIKEFGNSLDSLDSFTYKQFNYIFRARVFDNQDQKNATFQKLRANSEIYKKFQEQKSKNSRRRGKRSLFTEYQRLTIEDWIDRIQRIIDDNKSESRQARSDSTALGIGGAATGVTVLGLIGAIPTGPIGLLIAIFGGIATGTQLGLSIGSVAFKSPHYWNNAEKITRELDSLKTIFRSIKTSNNSDLEEGFKEKIKKIITNINKLSGNIINFDDFDVEEILERGY